MYIVNLMSSYLCVHQIIPVYILKGSKDYVMYIIWIHLMLCQKGLKIMLCTQYRYINAMSKGSKKLCYVERRDIHIFAHNFLNIQPIFNLKKSFGLRPFHYTMQCYVCQTISKGSKEALTVLIVTHVTHVKGVEYLGPFNFTIMKEYTLACGEFFSNKCNMLTTFVWYFTSMNHKISSVFKEMVKILYRQIT